MSPTPQSAISHILLSCTLSCVIEDRSSEEVRRSSTTGTGY